MSPDGSPNSFPSQSPTSSTSLSLVPASNVTTVSSSSLYITENSSVSFVQQWLRLKKFHNFQSKEIRQKFHCKESTDREVRFLNGYKSLLILAVKICLFYREMTLSKLDKKAQVIQTLLLNVSDFIMLSEGKYYI